MLDEMLTLPEVDPEAAEAAARKLEGLLKSIEESRDKAVSAKRPIEQRMIDDMRQYNGADRLQFATKDHATDGNNAAARVLPIPLTLTRNRTNTIIARWCDSAFPDHDPSWSITPPSDLDSIDESLMVDEQGQPIPRELWQEVANVRCGNMAELVESQLKAFSFNAVGRKCGEYLGKLGTAILHGPTMRKATKKQWRAIVGAPTPDNPTGRVLESVRSSVERPEAEAINPFDAYPEMAASIEDCERHHLVKMWSADQLKQFKLQGANAEAVEELIERGPDIAAPIYAAINERNTSLSQTDDVSKKYAVWRFDGALTKEEAITAGAVTEDYGCERVLCELWHCQGKVLKAKISPLEDDLRLPFFYVQYERIDDTMFGVGVPYLYRDTQRAINATYDAMMTNGSVSAGFWVLFRKGMINPMDGLWRALGPKWFETTDALSGRSLKDVMETYEFPNHTQLIIGQLQEIIRLGDEAISLPLMVQGKTQPGEIGAAVQTSSGMAMAMGAQNIVQKSAAMQSDDHMMKPFIERVGAWNMQYVNRLDIQCDFEVTTHVASNLVKDIQTQHLILMKQMVDADPDLKVRLKPDAWLNQMQKTSGMGITDMWRTDEEVQKVLEEQKAGQQDPMVAIEQQKLQLKEKEIAANAEAKRIDAESRIKVAELNYDAVMAQLAQAADLSVKQLMAKLEMHDKTEQTRKMTAAGNLRLGAEKVADIRRELHLKETTNKLGI